MLENGTIKSKDFLSQLKSSRVVSQCGCGCASIDFSVDGEPRKYGPLEILSEYWYGSDEERNVANVFLFAVDEP